MEKQITNALGATFLIETAKDFDDAGRMIDGRGFFVSVVDGNGIHSGIWFETYEQALDATNPSAFR